MGKQYHQLLNNPPPSRNFFILKEGGVFIKPENFCSYFLYSISLLIHIVLSYTHVTCLIAIQLRRHDFAYMSLGIPVKSYSTFFQYGENIIMKFLELMLRTKFSSVYLISEMQPNVNKNRLPNSNGY